MSSHTTTTHHTSPTHDPAYHSITVLPLHTHTLPPYMPHVPHASHTTTTHSTSHTHHIGTPLPTTHLPTSGNAPLTIHTHTCQPHTSAPTITSIHSPLPPQSTHTATTSTSHTTSPSVLLRSRQLSPPPTPLCQSTPYASDNCPPKHSSRLQHNMHAQPYLTTTQPAFLVV